VCLVALVNAEEEDEEDDEEDEDEDEDATGGVLRPGLVAAVLRACLAKTGAGLKVRGPDDVGLLFLFLFLSFSS
jgi:hypothetical protein